MDALLPVFVAILLAETGGRVQVAAHVLQLRYGQAAPILSALTLSSLASLGVAGIGGAVIATMIGFDARTLMAGLALLFAGGPMMVSPKPVPEGEGHAGPFRTSLARFLPLQFGDASQFIAFAFAARSGHAPLAIGAGLAAVLAAAFIPMVVGKDWPGSVPLSALRRGAGALLILAAFWMIVVALRLI